MQGNYAQAIAHIHSGCKILCELEYNEQTKEHHHGVLAAPKFPYVPILNLEELFLRLDISVVEVNTHYCLEIVPVWHTNVMQMVGGRKFNLYENTTISRVEQSIPFAFSSLTEARESLVFHWHRLMRPISEQYLDDKSSLEFLTAFQSRHDQSQRVFDQWSMAFNAYIKINGSSLAETELKGVAMLRIQQEIGFLSLQVGRTYFADQTLWDQFMPLFNRIVTLASEILDFGSKSRRYPTFSLDIGIVSPLYEVASRCRDPLIRRKAISLMKSRCMQEGVWNSILTAKVTERLVEIEEEGLGVVKSCHDVPDWARLSFVAPMFDPAGRRAVVKFMRIKNAEDAVRPMIEEVFEW
jgi:hypothetical protein